MIGSSPRRLDLILPDPAHPHRLTTSLRSQLPEPWHLRSYAWTDRDIHNTPAPDLVFTPGLDPLASEPVLVQSTHLHIRQWCSAQSLPLVVLYGTVEQQTLAALDTLQRQVNANATDADSHCTWHWNCEGCSDPACERSLFRRLLDT